MSFDNPLHTDLANEKALLSALYNNGTAAYVYIDEYGIVASDFYLEVNQMLFKCMDEILSSSSTNKIDVPSMITVANDFGLDGFEKKIIDNDYLKVVSEIKINPENTGIIAKSIKKWSALRHVSEEIKQIDKDLESVDSSIELSDLLALLENKTSGLTDFIINPNQKIEKIGCDVRVVLEHTIENAGKIGIPTGFPNYDVAIGGGLREGINTIGARAGVGKSFISMNVTNNVSNVCPVLYLDTELDTEYQLMRLAAMRTMVPINKIETGEWYRHPDFKEKINLGLKSLSNAPIYHCYVGGWAFEQIIAYAKKFIRNVVGYNEDGTTKRCVVIYDYLKLMDQGTIRGNLSEHQAIGFMMHTLHNFGKRYHAPILALVQLNREGIKEVRQGVTSQSDRIEWITSNLSILKDKDNKELSESGNEGNKKLYVIKSRFAAGTPGSYINIKADLKYGLMTEGKIESLFDS